MKPSEIQNLTLLTRTRMQERGTVKLGFGHEDGADAFAQTLRDEGYSVEIETTEFGGKPQWLLTVREAA